MKPFYEKYIIAVLFSLSFGLIIMSVTWFFCGYHNIDLSFNMNTINLQDTGRYYEDVGSDGVVRSPMELYMLGLKQIYNGFLLCFISAFTFGITWCIIIENYFEEKKGGFSR